MLFYMSAVSVIYGKTKPENLIDRYDLALVLNKPIIFDITQNANGKPIARAIKAHVSVTICPA